MKRITTKLPRIYLIEPDVRSDTSCYFMETYTTKKTWKGALRGIQLQNAPMA